MDDTDYRDMVREMLDADDRGFNNWEIEFLDAMYKRTSYTENMRTKIDEIYEAKM
jgi:hypothetical protein